jgi:hypothetical protein
VFPAKVSAEMLFRNAPVMVLSVLLIADKMLVVLAAMVAPVPVAVVSMVVTIMVVLFQRKRRSAHRQRQERRQTRSNQLHKYFSMPTK